MRQRAERVRYFSHGMQQHLAIARAILHSPRVLLLDEPHSGLDKNTAAQLDVLLQAEAAGGRSVVLVTHDVRSAWLAPARAAACTPQSLLELRSLDRACGLGRCADPGSGVRPDLGLVTPHRRVIVRAARRVRVRASFWRRAAGAWDCRVLVERWR